MKDFSALHEKIKQYRIKILETHFKAGAGHIGSSLSCADMMGVTFFQEKKSNDTFILSKGHAAVALYVALYMTNEVSEAELANYHKNGTTLPVHPPINKFPGIPFATGSLGHGMPVAAGIAIAKKMKQDKNSYVYVLLSDGETNTGTCWEAGHFAVKHQLNNLIVIVDKNRLQGFGSTEAVLGDTASANQWKAMGFEVVEVDGHNTEEITTAIQALKKSTSTTPKLIVANTIKGKGISFMENKLEWHYLPLTEEQYNLALQELKKSA